MVVNESKANITDTACFFCLHHHAIVSTLYRMKEKCTLPLSSHSRFHHTVDGELVVPYSHPMFTLLSCDS